MDRNNVNDRDIEEMVPASSLTYATVDYDRQKRLGVNEVVFGLGKSADQISGILQDMTDHGLERIAVTRIDEEKAALVRKRFPDAEYLSIPEMLIYDEDKMKLKDPAKKADSFGLVSVVTAGTSDLKVAEEAACMSEFLHHEVLRVYDVGVAGIHRLLNRIEEIRKADVVIVVAGMEGALASVVGGLVSKPVIAVPTSIGYGASFQGLSPLLSMLNSCASGVGVVNIDNGFGAAMLANRILGLLKEKMS